MRGTTLLAAALTMLYLGTGCATARMKASSPRGIGTAQKPAAVPSTYGEASGPCGQYLQCCYCLADALASTNGISRETVDGLRSSCAEMEGQTGVPEVEEACTSALEGIGQAIPAYRQLPGFTMPDVCWAACGPSAR